MEPTDSKQQHQVLQKIVRRQALDRAESSNIRLQDQSSMGLDYELWQVGHIVASARSRLAEFQAALGETQLECRRLTRECESLQTLYDDKSDSLSQSWAEYDRLSQALQEETSKNQEVSESLAQKTLDLQAEVCRRQIAEASLVQHEKTIAEYQQMIDGKDHTIKKLGEDCARYIASLVGLQEHLDQERAATEKLRRSMRKSEANGGETNLLIGSEVALVTSTHGDLDDNVPEDTADISPVIGKRQKKRKTRS